ncbi:MAG: qaraquat-inducible protein [Proteobacteria bacterium]|nr:qaraquat-inducible protein [Pseudomonadota bacterium]
MNPTEPAAPEHLPTGRVSPPRRRLNMIWIVPLLAVLVGLGLVAKTILARGPEVTLQFAQAEGLEANKTRVKFKDVDVGTVKSIALNPDRASVRVTVQMDKQAEGLLVEDSRFWVVRPRIAAGNISGLATLLSGVYIAVDPGKSEESRDEFIGLEEPPQVTSNTPGRQFKLSADDLGSLDVGSPVYFRRIRVGRVVGYSLQKDGSGVDVRVFVDAPYDRLVTEATRFWHASGLELSLNADGVKLDMQSLLSLALGGVAFASSTEDAPAARAEPAASYTLHADQRSALSQPESRVEKYVLTFHESLRGLAVGAPVDYRGLIAGEVSRIDLNFDSGDAEFAVLVEVTLYPDRFARRSGQPVDREISDKLIRQTLDRMVAKGFRAQARTGNLLTGQLYVALDFFPRAKAAKIIRTGRIPELPTEPAMLVSLQDQLLPIVESLRLTLQHVDALVLRVDKEVAPEVTATLRDARKTMDSADRMLATADKALHSDAPLQAELRETLREVGKAATAVRNLADLLERQPESLISGKK